MKTGTKRLLEELEQIADQVGIRVRYDMMTGLCAGKGGLCRVKGGYRLIVDRRTTNHERVGYLVDALARFDLEEMYLSPQARRAIGVDRKAVAAAAND
ncbi:MAG: hypothetical protein J7M25_02795 [Deltaproteobacteria bacterium]|nr:hypothetical protein [Deltaproteobacteria bacterium]